MANGLVVADTGISVGGRAVLGANLGRVQVGMVTHTSDTALATKAGGGSQIGSAVSMVIPAAGIIRLTILEMEYDETEGNAAYFATGLKVGSDSVLWSKFDKASDGAEYILGRWQAAASVTSIIVSSGMTNSRQGIADNHADPAIFCWDIAGRSVTTGTKDVEVWFGDNNESSTGEITVTGTTTTARFLVEVIDGS